MVMLTKDEPNRALTILSLTIKSEDSFKKHGINKLLKILKFCLVNCLKNFNASKNDNSNNLFCFY